jgi:hypothetical protein
MLTRLTLIALLILISAPPVFAEESICTETVWCEDWDDGQTDLDAWDDSQYAGDNCTPSGIPSTTCEGINTQRTPSGSDSSYSVKIHWDQGDNWDDAWGAQCFSTSVTSPPATNEWTYFRWYWYFTEADFTDFFQCKGFYLGKSGSDYLLKFQMRDYGSCDNKTDVDGSAANEPYFAFHSYSGGELIGCVYDSEASGQDFLPKDLKDAWHYYELAVHPQNRQVKLYIDGTLVFDSGTNWELDSSYIIPTNITFNHIELCGTCGNSSTNVVVDTDWFIANMVVDDSYIGPLGGETPGPSVSGITFSGVTIGQ